MADTWWECQTFMKDIYHYEDSRSQNAYKTVRLKSEDTGVKDLYFEGMGETSHKLESIWE